MNKRSFLSVVTACFLWTFGTPVFHATAEQPPVILTITLPGAETGTPQVIALTEQDLRALPALSYDTTTIWTTGKQRFTGVPLFTLLEHFDIEAAKLELQAVNDYSIALPVDEITPDAPIVAYERNNKPMKLRDKGPLWLIYDYDSNADYRTETIFSRSIWQLDRITAIR